MDKNKAARDIITHALPLVPFDGWNMTTLGNAALDAGYKKSDIIRVFSGGAINAVDFYSRMADEEMLSVLAGYNLDTMKIRNRIATAVRLRLDLQIKHREAVRKLVSLYALPYHASHSLRALYATVDDIWHAIGDTSTDFNFYTKRMTLAAVYSSTVLIWLDDTSPNQQATWDFLDRRIENVMQFEKAKSQLKSWLGKAKFS